jgi:hypothetical protein
MSYTDGIISPEQVEREYCGFNLLFNLSNHRDAAGSCYMVRIFYELNNQGSVGCISAHM